MKSLLSISIVGLALTFSTLPASAREFQSPRGRTGNINRVVTPKEQGGYTRYRTSSFTGVNGGNFQRERNLQTDGRGNFTRTRSGSATAPNGQTVNFSSSGNGGYNSTSGYSGQNTTTINGKTYNSSTQNGLTTVTTPSGTKTFTHPRYYRRY